MSIINFPDPPPAGSNKTPATIDNVDHLLRQNGITVRYNSIKKKDEISIPAHKGTSDNLDNVALTKIISLAAKEGLPTGLIPDYVQAIADGNAYSPVADWIKSKAWDSTDRLDAICDTVIVNADYPADLKATLIKKWLLSATAAALMPAGFKSRGVLTLQGPQGIGKTSWVKSLICDPALRDSVIKLDHHLDSNNKDSILGAISNWLVEIGELESSFRKDIARLKGFLTTDSDRVRRPYGKRESDYARRTVFLATVNDANFLIDSTGNSRWWTIPVQSLNFAHSIDMQQVYAQLAVHLHSNAEWWLTRDEEARLDLINQRHRVVNAVAERLADYIDLEAIGHITLPSMSASEMLKHMGFQNPTNQQCKDCATALRDILGDHKRIRGINKWYIPIKIPDPSSLIASGNAFAKSDEY